MSFKKQNYLIIKNAVPKEIAEYSYHYLLLKRAVFYKDDTLRHFGNYGDPMIPNSYCHYSDILMETLYKKGDELKKHKDRPSCAVSTTLNLGGTLWPIYLEPLGKTAIKINLKQGDMLIYDGCLLEHWRKPFTGKTCAQVFLHYNTSDNETNKFDGRPMLGLPLNFTKNAQKK